jgi:hypothetical protein
MIIIRENVKDKIRLSIVTIYHNTINADCKLEVTERVFDRPSDNPKYK